ncbi:type II secretion system F family protein [Microvirga sp. BT689]|uniref:type II secretion system F family protein n=1 Tax=Microvirga arvi TaxID=2778731 RepID=UPI0019504081|nr:type II secretion system F family protein [Microvirga arvi]MBM6583671.1 type II secretion system F family protein [Microvirga arvi]
MSPELIIAHADTILAFSAAISVFAATLLVSWPYFAPDPLSARMAQVASERERIRLRERARLMAQNRPLSLRREPKKLFQDIVDRFNLTKHAEDGDLVRMLRSAGFRGHGPVVTYVAVRVLAPAGMLLLGAVYVFVLLDLQRPFIVKLAMVVAAGGFGYKVPWLYVKNRITKRQTAIRRSWPDALDLLLICVECGMAIEGALRKVSEEIGVQCPELAEELSLTTAELSYLQDRRKAYENLAERTDLDGVKSVVTSLIQSEKYGTPLGQSLRVLAQESRDARMSEAEKRAAALPPKLTVPMILFFLPVLFAVIITPAALQVMNLK